MHTILVLRTVHWDCWSVKLDALTAAARKRGWQLQLVDHTSAAAVRKLLDFWHPHGVVVVESGPATRSLPPQLFGHTPADYLDAAPDFFKEPFSFVSHNAAKIVQDAVREFFMVGCEHFAYVGWPESVHWSEDKRTAFVDLVQLHGKVLHEFCPTKTQSQRSRDKVNTLTRTKNLRRFLTSLPTPCGVLAVNDLIAWQVLSAAESAGLDVPGDLAVIGVDNDPIICEQTKPTLTSFELDFARSGEAALELIERWSPGMPCRRLIAPLKLVRRQSTQRLPCSDADVSAALERIRRESCSGLTARAVADGFGCSRRLAEQRFRALCGSSILQEIKRVQFERAFELLRAGDVKIEAIADFCGFRSTTIFYRQFKAMTGLTPRQWIQAKVEMEGKG